MTPTAAALNRLGLTFTTETTDTPGPLADYVYYDEDLATYQEGN